ncbi:MAG: protein phosphatase 2C domain-containing protein [Bryobacterales bacterium]|nr:protein phosphatase 2C domain-containing protein [Bryobacterales bacterium]MBV9399057.1 protein phosphatase 2C domain-containing protein [Bryobacterales bacterium]
MTGAVTWTAGIATHPGLLRSNNEDRVFVDETDGIFLVVDGIGGQAAGETAAETAVRVIAEQLAHSNGSAEERVRGSITAANNEIFDLAQAQQDWRGMACVLTLAVIDDDRVVVGHVGDSRLYVMQGGKLRKLTSDHSPVGEREDQGEISEREAMADPRRNQVFRDVGSRPRQPDEDDFIEVHSFPFRADAALLLCSDGLSDCVPSIDITAIIETYDGDAEAVSQRLTDAANEAGGKDNISVIFVAGADFSGAAAARARRRHAITRLRQKPWKIALSRAVWLLGGMLMGTALWAFLNRSTLDHSQGASRRIAVAASDPRAIASALSVAQPGDTLDVAPGEYFGPIEMRDEINLISRTPGAAIIRLDPAAVADAGIAFAARGIHHGRISGFRIAGSKAVPLATGILVDGANLEIDDVDISGAADCAIRIVSGSSPVIHASDLHDNPGCGIWIGGDSSPQIAGNRIAGNGIARDAPRAGIELHPPAAPTIERNIITGNGAPNVEEDIGRANVTGEGKP